MWQREDGSERREIKIKRTDYASYINTLSFSITLRKSMARCGLGMALRGVAMAIKMCRLKI